MKSLGERRGQLCREGSWLVSSAGGRRVLCACSTLPGNRSCHLNPEAEKRVFIYLFVVCSVWKLEKALSAAGPWGSPGLGHWASLNGSERGAGAGPRRTAAGVLKAGRAP